MSFVSLCFGVFAAVVCVVTSCVKKGVGKVLQGAGTREMSTFAVRFREMRGGV